MACLAADGVLKPGQPWRQEGILGTVFEGSFEFENEAGAAGDRHLGESAAIFAHRSPDLLACYRRGHARSSILHDPFRLGVPE